LQLLCQHRGVCSKFLRYFCGVYPHFVYRCAYYASVLWFTPLTSAYLSLTVPHRNETLADMSRAAWRLKQRKIAIQCAELALEGNIVSKILKVNPV
jgi:hypothetical protein